jgi:glutaredoxin
VKAKVVIYSRPGCHLCDAARQNIDGAACDADYSLEIINIESDPALLRKYKNDIPVVTINGVETFKHRVDSNLFKEAVKKAQRSR